MAILNSSLFRIVSSFAAIVCVGAAAQGAVTPVGTAFPHGSWGQTFNEAPLNFDHMQIISLTGAGFDVPVAFQNFSDGSWSQTFTDGTLAIADGNTLNNMNFDIIFAGASDQPLSFCFQAYDGQTLVDSADAFWNGGSWTIISPGSCPDVRVTPAPGAAAALGLASLIGLRRRRSH